MNVTWYTTASLRLTTPGADLLFDPFVPLPGAQSRVTASDYVDYGAILITHGHFDHLRNVREIHKSGHPVYCTKTPSQRLLAQGIGKSSIETIKPGDVLSVGDAEITVHPGKHIEFDRELVRNTLFNSRVFRYRANVALMAKSRKDYPENGETVIFEVKAQGKTALILGSLNWVWGYAYPVRPDLLVVPYQGNSDLFTPAMKFCENVQPKTVLLDHFDDSFPPLTRNIDTAEFQNAMKRRFPGVRVTRPQPFGSVEV